MDINKLLLLSEATLAVNEANNSNSTMQSSSSELLNTMHVQPTIEQQQQHIMQRSSNTFAPIIAPAHNAHNHQQQQSVTESLPNSPTNSTEDAHSNDSTQRDLTINTKTRRDAHVKSEQKRRLNINEGFTQLRQVIPFCGAESGAFSTGINCPVSGSGDSKAATLRKAVAYIRFLQGEVMRLQQELSCAVKNKENGAMKCSPSITPVNGSWSPSTNLWTPYVAPPPIVSLPPPAVESHSFDHIVHVPKRLKGSD